MQRIRLLFTFLKSRSSDYFSLGRFVAENKVRSGIRCSLDICQYEYILNKASTPPAQQQIGLQLSGFSLLQTEAGLTRDLVGKQT